MTITTRSCPGLRSGVHRIADGHCARTPDRATTTGLPRRDQRAGDAAATAHERPQGRGDPRPAPPDHGRRTATARREGPVHPHRSGLPRRPAAPTPPPPCRAGSDCWYAPPPRCAGTTTRSPGITPAHLIPGVPARRPRRGPSTRWYYARPERTGDGATGASTLSCSPWAPPSPRPPSRRSSPTPASTRHPSRPATAGRRSYAPRAEAIPATDLCRNGHADRSPHVRPSRHRARHPPGSHPGPDHAPDRDVGHPGRAQPGDGPPRRRPPDPLPGSVTGTASTRRCSTWFSPTQVSRSRSVASGRLG